MATIKLTPHPHAVAIQQYAEIMKRGECNLWMWRATDSTDTLYGYQEIKRSPGFEPNPSFWYEFHMKSTHPHYDLWREWQELVKSGAVGRGEAWIDFDGGKTELCEWRADTEYKIVRAQPKLKLIDWAKMPRGVMTNAGELIGFADGSNVDISILADVETMFHNANELRLAPADQQPWLLWTGGECPVPDGVLVEVCYRCGVRFLIDSTCFHTTSWKHATSWKHHTSRDDIIAYRVTGLAPCYTDDPKDAA